ncbi:MAG: transposase, partial [Streptosporangiaceae bacterium]|nr:transposase [Streptosporangiaceae bacterium]
RIYGASVSKETVSRITDKVIVEMRQWANRPWDAVSAGSVPRRPCRQGAGGPGRQPAPVYAAVEVAVDGHKDAGSMDGHRR